MKEMPALSHLGQLVPCLMSGAEDLSSWVTIPLCRIKERHPDGMLELDPEFIPSVMTTHSSTALTRYLGEVTASVTNRAEELAKRIGAPSQQGIADVAEFMMLQMFNRNQTKFAHRSALARLHPEIFYLDLISLYGELVTFTEESRLSEKLGFYQQENLTETFHQIMPRLRKALSTVLAPRAMNLPLTYMDGIYAAVVNDSTLLQSATFVLAVKAQMPHENITSPICAAIQNQLGGKNPQCGAAFKSRGFNWCRFPPHLARSLITPIMSTSLWIKTASPGRKLCVTTESLCTSPGISRNWICSFGQ